MNRPKRASSAQNGSATTMTKTKSNEPDTFESRVSEEILEPPRASIDLEDLPIELIGLTDSFIDQLSAKVHPSPPNIDNLAGLFQDFYETAAQHIQTHISAVASRQSRESSPAPSNSSRASAASLLRAKAASLGGGGSRDKTKSPVARVGSGSGNGGGDSDQQMLTVEELADRKRARKALEIKKGLYEEAVERRLCEGIYGKIYRHRTTQDEAQDHKLRSKTAALAVVGIGPTDLGVDLHRDATTTTPEAIAERQAQVKSWLSQARKELVLMHESRYPLGKLNRLKAAHKSIIDTLSHFLPSSSADELMPMLIYTLITMPPDDLNVVSDVNFIHRFRWERKLVGEAAYCLTSLEAAISFLETVDLSTLRADEAPSGPLNLPDGPSPPKAETFPPAYSSPGVVITVPDSPEKKEVKAAESQDQQQQQQQPTNSSQKPTLSASAALQQQQQRNRRFSDLVNTPVQAIGAAASDAVDQSLKTIGNSLGDSYKFLMSRLRENPAGLTGSGGELAVPKTLEDARKLIGTPPPLADEDGSEDGSAGGEALPGQLQRAPTTPTPRDDKVLNLIGGRKVVVPPRDRSADGARGAKKADERGKEKEKEREKEKEKEKEKEYREKAANAGAAGTVPPASSNPALIDSVRNLGNTLNPMARLSAGIGGFRGFGRVNSSPAPQQQQSGGNNNNTKEAASVKGAADGGDLTTAFPELASVLPPREVPKIRGPVKRFMELQNPGDLRLGDVIELLRDYRRLAGALKERDAFKD